MPADGAPLVRGNDRLAAVMNVSYRPSPVASRRCGTWGRTGGVSSASVSVRGDGQLHLKDNALPDPPAALPVTAQMRMTLAREGEIRLL